MKVDLNRYRRGCLPAIRAMLINNKDIPRLDLVGIIAVAINCPIIAVGCFVQEIEGASPELTEKVARDVTFYKVTEIVGKI